MRICLQGHQPFAAGVEALRATLTALRSGTDPADLSGVASAEYMTKVTTGEAYKKRIADWL